MNRESQETWKFEQGVLRNMKTQSPHLKRNAECPNKHKFKKLSDNLNLIPNLHVYLNFMFYEQNYSLTKYNLLKI